MKENKGVSIIALIVTITIIIILITITWSSGIGNVNEANKTKIDVEIGYLKEAVSTQMTNHVRNPEKYPFVGERLTTEEATKYISTVKSLSNSAVIEINSKINEDTIQYFRLIDSTSAETLGVDSVDKNHYFIVDYETGNVYGTVDMK